MPWVLGLDGGSTKTIALVANEKGRVLGRGESGPSNYHTAGVAGAGEAIRLAVATAIEDAGLVGQALSGAFFAFAGVDRQIDRQVLSSIVSSTGLRCPVQIDHLAAAALAGANSGNPGVVVIAGTGAVAYGEDGHGCKARAGGYGPILGDEGSGYDIGRKALVAALRAEDGRSPTTILSDRIGQTFMLDSMTELVNLVYGNPAPLQRTEIAALTLLVVEVAKEGDPVAREILRESGRELGLSAAAVLKQLMFTGDEKVVVAGVGSVFAGGNFVALPMEQVIRTICPQAELCQPQHTTAYGAVLLALRNLGIRLESVPGERS
jgi:N-acetylglucosamine kinase-like BadF-type ATPase